MAVKKPAKKTKAAKKFKGVWVEKRPGKRRRRVRAADVDQLNICSIAPMCPLLSVRRDI
jgi:hypothetical protein